MQTYQVLANRLSEAYVAIRQKIRQGIMQTHAFHC